MTVASPSDIAERYARVRDEVGPDVTVVVATKYVTADELVALAEAGVEVVGENRAQDLERKQIANRVRLSRFPTRLPFLTAVNPRRPGAMPGCSRFELRLPCVHGFTGRSAKTRHAVVKVAAEQRAPLRVPRPARFARNDTCKFQAYREERSWRTAQRHTGQSRGGGKRAACTPRQHCTDATQ